jgi:3-hydroxyacyl-CoA dehydrogenase/enoyl-CoA hydratase/3-hydroxybutyryl-CoA epimerase
VRRRTEAKVRPDHYPAPFAVIDMWRRHGDDPRAMMAAEARSISELIVGETARNLIRVFFLQERLKGMAKTSGGKGRSRFAHVHVIGGGVMGGDIAAWCALRGLRVSVQDQSSEALARVMQRAHELFRAKLKTPREVQAAGDRLMPDPRGDGLQSADVVIEAIFEDAAAKQKLFKSIEPQLRKDALLATNTSSIPLEELAKALKRPSRLVGLHFFNPVAKMQLVEVVAGAKTTKTGAASAAAFAGAIGRLPLPVRSGPGFLVNRILMPYLLEAVILEEEGMAIETIDRAALDFGMPMGPIRLADAVGLDICLSIAENLAAARGYEVPARLQKLVAAGHLGRKSGRGFYRYSAGQLQQPARAAVPPAAADLGDRLILRMLNEAVACLREGVVADADLADAGVVFGTGFAPFRGGPMHYIDTHGRGALRARLAALHARYGDRFAPDPGWEKPKHG